MSACSRWDSSRVSAEVGSSMMISRPAAERAEDLDLLLVGDAEAADPGVAGDPKRSTRRQLRRSGCASAAVDERAVPRLDAEEDVLHHRHVRRERQLLGDERDAVGRAPREAIRTGPPRPSRRIRPSVGRDRAGDIFPTVDLPAPFSPTSACTVPAAIDRLTLSTARTLPNRFERPCSSTRGAVATVMATSEPPRTTHACSSGCSSVRTFLLSATSVLRAPSAGRTSSGRASPRTARSRTRPSCAPASAGTGSPKRTTCRRGCP